jgi:serine/threonine-protein kinase HipA
MEFQVQIHVHGDWHDAANLSFDNPEGGIRSPVVLDYDLNYWSEHASEDAMDGAVIDRRALSLLFPVDVSQYDIDHWPAWLLDLLPQGVARERISKDIGLRNDDPALDIELLLRAGGSPIGNIRIKEAWEAEQERISGAGCPPLTDADIRDRTETFMDVVDRFAHLASGSSGVQGEWPKALMTRSRHDGHWYPDPFVDTQDGIEHVIVKLLKSTTENDRLILEAEAPYLELARAFGLNCAEALEYHPNVLVMPRFDRDVVDGEVFLHGQESMISAVGVAEFGARRNHEDYLAVIDAFSDDPISDRIEYLLRDVLNMACGNPDNHGRNTAMQRKADGGIRLSPLFDFAPMRMSDAGIARTSRWQCLDGGDRTENWGPVCGAVACDGLTESEVFQVLHETIPFLKALPETALEIGVPEAVVERAIDPDLMIKAIEEMEAL